MKKPMIMNNKNKVDNQTPDPTAEIQAAIDTINEFNQQQEAAEKAQITDLIRFVIHRFSETREKNRKETQDKLQAAVKILKQHFTLLPKLEEGSAQEKNLALFAREVIGRFNHRLDRWKSKSALSAKEKIALLLAEHHELLLTMEKIELPLNQRRIQEFAEKNEEKPVVESSVASVLLEASHKVSKVNFIKPFAGTLPWQKIPHLSTQAAQLFYMKMIALIESHLKLPHFEARQLASRADIKVEINLHTGICHIQGSIEHADNWITVTGAFEKDPKSSTYNIPGKIIPFQWICTNKN